MAGGERVEEPADRLHLAVASPSERLGPRRVDAATRVLREIIELHGADSAIRPRRVRPPR